MTTTVTIDNIRQTIETAFPFEVQKLRLQGPDNLPTPHYGLFRDDKTDISACLPVAVKEGYEPHTREDLIALCEAAVIGFNSEENATIQCRWNRRGHRVVIEPSKDYRRSIHGTKDNVFPRAIIRSDYGRTFGADFGLYRDACSNLMMPRAAGEVISVNLRHTAGLREKLDDLVEDFKELAANCDNVYDIAAKLEAKRVSVAEFMGKLYKVDDDANARTRKSNERRIEKMISRLIDERVKTGRPAVTDLAEASCWELLNAVTGYVQHDKTRRNSKERDELDRALLAVDDREAVKTWDHAMTLCA